MSRQRRTQDQKLAGGYFTTEGGGYWVHLPFADGWVAAQRLGLQGGELVVSELRVFPAEKPRGRAGQWSGAMASVPKGGVTSPLLRSASVGRHAAAPVVSDWVSTAGGWSPTTKALARRVSRDLRLPDSSKPRAGVRGRPGRKPTDCAFYEKVAEDYRRWAGQHPAKRIAEKHGVSGATARTWIHTARHTLGLLPKTEPGRPSLFRGEDGRAR